MSETTPSTLGISSFSSPTDEDITHWGTLSDDAKRALLAAELDKAGASGVSMRSLDDLWQDALRRAGR